MSFFSNKSPPKVANHNCRFFLCFTRRPPPRKLPCSLCRLLPALTCVGCHGRHCFTSSSSWSSEFERRPHSPGSNFDNKQVVIWEIQRRARELTKLKQTNYPLANWEWLIAPNGVMSKTGGRQDDDDEEEEEATETFYSVRSYLSRCSSEGGSMTVKESREKVIWEELRHCEGWPFGLLRRGGHVMLPPLPRSPSDSWTWRKRMPVAPKTCV